ncbi:WD40 repeat domain-containing serine/threonine protein kinase [Tuwongella immobilis]|uniref:Protein kinase domain-containing protein n=1 Tax=Tuwongella immobilis TaxID=692036 RepID=A0A6C2YJB4_9BACT|nr:serine/threonine-protein kinase [Tuwongella immobilis]VIP01371.1 wd40 repeat-containing protein : Uncultured bacterium genome assembly Metasoil_fosmids_resub OS=uncultured bacterium PE=4 SV=1: Pkinase: WD40 [Tuwongella immobilis]VTR98206.1 wd40 repeat-containing protein : Uncultured bacterium genome assembly Metasoil_fosmids_resub OS=uncultured bacterium PE=4 SV=1: Pkinase: WD40 [Tuwongella immobilis]
MERPQVDDPMQQFRAACQQVDRCVRAGEPSILADWVAPGAPLLADLDLAVELVFTEYVTREMLGQKPSPDEYYNRFPHLAKALAQLFQVDQLLQDSQSLQPEHERSRSTLPDGTWTGLHRPNRAMPTHLGRYRILQELGAGGMGIVYHAWDGLLRRPVAIKLIRSGAAASESDLARLRQEAAALARCSHSHLVQIFEVGESEGQPFLVLEYVPGPTLREQLSQGPLAPHDAAHLLERLALAMDHAHLRGVLHRDLKPANILLQVESKELPHSQQTERPTEWTGPWTPKITDFGLAVLRTSDDRLTETGHLIGTIAYMAPEQAEGRPGWVQPAVDLYALGVILYECLTGRPPFLADSPVELMRRISQEEVPAIRLVAPQVPRDLQVICERCLRKRPDQRYESAADLAADLRRFLEGKSILARPQPIWERSWRWIRRNQTLSGLSIVGVVAVVGMLIAWAQFTHRLALERDATRQQRNLAITALSDAQTANATAQAEQARAEQLLRDREGMLYAATITRAAMMATTNPILAQSLLQSPERCPPQQRDFAWNFLHSMSRSQLVRPTESRAGINAIALAPMSRRLVSVDQGGNILLWNSATAQLEMRLRSVHSGAVTAVAISTDGRWLVTGGSDGTVGTLSLPEGKISGEIQRFPGEIHALAISANGDEIAAAATSAQDNRQGTALRLWRRDAPQTQREFARPGSVRAVQFSPDSRRLLAGYASHDAQGRLLGESVLWNIATGKPAHVQAWPGSLVRAIGFSPDGSLFAAANGEMTAQIRDSAEPTIRVWKSADLSQVASLSLSLSVTQLAFRPDARTIVVGASDSSLTCVDWQSGESTHRLPPHEAKIPIKRDADADAPMPPLQPYAAQGQSLRSVSGLGWDVEGRWLMSSGADGTLRWTALAEDRQARSYTLANAAIYGADGFADGWVWTHYNASLVQGSSQSMQHRSHAIAGQVKLVATSPDQKRVAVAVDRLNDRNEIGRWLVVSELGSAQPLFEGPFPARDGVTGLCWDLDGEWVHALQGPAWVSWSRESKRFRFQRVANRTLGSLARGPENECVWLIQPAGIELQHLGQSEPSYRWAPPEGRIIRHSVSADGRTLLLTVHRDPRVRMMLYRIVWGETPSVTILPVELEARSVLTISPDARNLAVTHPTRREIAIWHLATLQELFRVHAPLGIYRLHFSGDNRHLAAFARSGNRRETLFTTWGTIPLHTHFAIPTPPNPTPK